MLDMVSIMCFEHREGRGVSFSVASPWRRGVFHLGNGVGTYIVLVKILRDRCLTSVWDEVGVGDVPLNKVHRALSGLSLEVFDGGRDG